MSRRKSFVAAALCAAVLTPVGAAPAQACSTSLDAQALTGFEHGRRGFHVSTVMASGTGVSYPSDARTGAYALRVSAAKSNGYGWFMWSRVPAPYAASGRFALRLDVGRVREHHGLGGPVVRHRRPPRRVERLAVGDLVGRRRVAGQPAGPLEPRRAALQRLPGHEPVRQLHGELRRPRADRQRRRLPDRRRPRPRAAAERLGARLGDAAQRRRHEGRLELVAAPRRRLGALDRRLHQADGGVLERPRADRLRGHRRDVHPRGARPHVDALPGEGHQQREALRGGRRAVLADQGRRLGRDRQPRLQRRGRARWGSVDPGGGQRPDRAVRLLDRREPGAAARRRAARVRGRDAAAG